MAKKGKNKLQTKWIIALLTVVVLTTIVGVLKKNIPQSPQSKTGYQTYQSSTYGFTIEYPIAWEIRKDTQVFEHGDAIAFGIAGLTQKKNTELTDGAQIVISKPFSIGKDLETWVREYYDRYAEFSKISINRRSFEKVNYCSRIGCMTYYYTQINDQTYSVAVFTEGPDKDKMVYENTTLYMLKSIRFDNTKNGAITKENAVIRVKALPEVIDYLKRVPNGLTAVNSEEDNTYMVQVYEFKDGHTATFNWYTVNKTTGKVEKEF